MRASAWRDLLALGQEVYDAVASLARDSTRDRAIRDEGEKALVALNQSVVLGEWQRAMARATAAGSRSGGGVASPAPVAEEVAVEEGALLLVAFYRTGEQLLFPERAVDVRAELDALADRLSAQLKSPITPIAAVQALSSMLFERDGFAGNVDDYYDPGNSLLDKVLATRKGIPISLSVLFAAVCARVGVSLDMIGLPGHFLLATRPQAAGEERVFVDAFHGGRLLTLEHCEHIVRSYGVPWSADHARPVPIDEVWSRQVRNLLNCHKQTGDFDRMLLAERLLQSGDQGTPYERTANAAIPYPSDEKAGVGGGDGALIHILQSLLARQNMQ